MVLNLLFSTATVAYVKTAYYATNGIQSGYSENATTSSVYVDSTIYKKHILTYNKKNVIMTLA